MSENFADLFEESLSQLSFNPGSVIKAEVIEVNSSYIVVNAGLKTESYISVAEFKDNEGKVEVEVGDQVDVVLDAIENGCGETKLSREKAKRAVTWIALEKAHDEGNNVKGTIIERVRGGFTVELERVKAFLPGSLVDVRPVRDPSYLEGQELEFRIIKLDKKRKNIVLSRRDLGGENEEALEALQEGQEVVGIVKNLTDYGAFVDLGGVDGLLHITDMSWKRVKHPKEMLEVGEKIKVVVLKYDRDKNRVSLGLKQLADDPWRDIGRRYPIGSRLFGKVTNITDYGCFVEIESGIEGLVHMSEMDWTNKNIHPAKVVGVGTEVEVMVLELDEERRRISLGMKQCQDNPWDAFAATHQKGEKIKGNIKSITDFGIFVGLTGDIDGLVHLSDISWTETGEQAIRNYKKGQEVEAVILAIDSERERISLGVKQLEDDIYVHYFAEHPKGSEVTGKVTEVAKGVTVQLDDGIEGKIKLADISRTRVNDASDFFDVDDEIKAIVIGLDKKSRFIALSTKELEADTGSDAPANTTLGDLLKEQMEKE
ncbi:MAG: 30S ribosomal protein S1 [Gammaproteobacteria bacterium]|nr:30S ribosomal protein S1 [Gammaproteobacteria bacterium]